MAVSVTLADVAVPPAVQPNASYTQVAECSSTYMDVPSGYFQGDSTVAAGVRGRVILPNPLLETFWVEEPSLLEDGAAMVLLYWIPQVAEEGNSVGSSENWHGAQLARGDTRAFLVVHRDGHILEVEPLVGRFTASGHSC